MKKLKGLVGKIKEPTAEELFPNFIDYLKKEYGPLAVENLQGSTNRQTWIISKISPTMERTIGATPVGVIKSYVKEKAMSSEYGYQVKVDTKGKRLKLEYRAGYLLIDTNTGSIIANKDPKRYDKEEIPFP